MAQTGGDLPLRDRPYVVVDVETTGLSPLHDRVIEVAALRLRDGAPAERFSSLVDPGCAIPPEIARLTGIRREMLAGQPRFAEIAAGLADFLGADPLVAHNAPFDYGFLVEEFRRAGLAYRARTLCTARLGRQVLPGLRRAGLGELLAALELEAPAAHRAAGDALATARAFLALLERAEAAGATTLGGLLRLPSDARAALAADLGAQVRQLPNAPGVYCFRDGAGRIVYIGKARQLRRRVQSHFRPSVREPRRLRHVLGTVQSIEHHATGSELEALLLESRLIKQYLPAGNQAQRDYHQYPYLRLDAADPFPRLSVTRSLAADGAVYYGPFHRAQPLQAAIAELQVQFHLPRCQGPILPGITPMCIYGQMGRCLAPCAGKISREGYAAVVQGVQGLLAGREDGVVTRMERRRDELAEELRFEEAATLRDAADELRLVFGAQRTLNVAVHECHTLVLASSPQAGAVEAFAIRAGLLAEQRRLRPDAPTAEELAAWLAAVYGRPMPADAHVRNDQLDELHIIAGWLRRESARHPVIAVDPALPAAAAPALAAAVAGFDLLTASRAAG